MARKKRELSLWNDGPTKVSQNAPAFHLLLLKIRPLRLGLFLGAFRYPFVPEVARFLSIPHLLGLYRWYQIVIVARVKVDDPVSRIDGHLV